METPVIDTKKKLKSPFSPYDVILVGYDEHPAIAADSKDERARKVYVELFDERVSLPLLQAHVEMTKSRGVQVPIQYLEFGGAYYVVDGRQRIKAAREVYDEQVKLGIEPAHLITVPGIKYQGSIDEMFANSRAMNVHVNEPPMMVARSMSRLLMQDVVDAPGEKPRKRTVLEVAAIYGVSDQTVRNYQKLFTSSDTVKKALAELKQPTIGLLLTGLPEDQQLAVLGELQEDAKAGKKVTVERAKGKVAAAKGKASASPKDRLDSLATTLAKLADRFGKGQLKRTESSTKEELLATITDLLTTTDAIARVVLQGKQTFPTPIKDQEPGYTLVTIDNAGD